MTEQEASNAVDSTTSAAATANVTSTASAPDATPAPEDAFDPSTLYEPSLKHGIHRLLATVLDLVPAKARDNDAYQGWQFTVALEAEADDESGGKLPVGTKLSYLNLYTAPGTQYDVDGKQGKEKAGAAILALNNIAVNKRKKESVAAAALAYKALDADKRRPSAMDESLPHFEQWKGTQAVFVLKSELGKNGETRVKLLGVEAASTAKPAETTKPY